MVETLVKNSRYNGKYVALESFNSHKVVGEGGTAQEAYNKAVVKGYKEPVIIFVSIKGKTQIY